jgi:quercetin dioxygenase-like cupin family protein
VIVEVIGGADERPKAQVVDVDDLSRLRLALGEVTDEEAAEALERDGFGRLQDGSAALDVAAVRAAAEPRATAPTWSENWDRMITAARGEGRLTEDGAWLRVPVESAAGG